VLSREPSNRFLRIERRAGGSAHEISHVCPEKSV
jgi:hypothetical protein